MTNSDVKAALAASVRAEQDAVQDRLAKAEAYFTAREQQVPPPPSRSPFSAEEPPAADLLEEPAPEKVIRDGFTMPVRDYTLIAQLQDTSLQTGLAVTKSEVLRAGLHALRQLSPSKLRQILMQLEKVKPGRPARR